MIWFTIALAVVSFIALALLTPKPELEDARAEELDPEQFPRATEDAPIPLLLGLCRIQAPNTLWYGDFRAKAQKKKVKTGLWSSTKVTTGYKYYIGMNLGLCLGPCSLHKIYIDSVPVEAGIQSDFSEEDLYTGDALWIFYYTGSPQPADTLDLVNDVGLSPAAIDSGTLFFEFGCANFNIVYNGTSTSVPGSWGLDIKMRDGDGVWLPVPDPGPNDDGLTGDDASADFGESLHMKCRIPAGTRTIDYYGWYAPFVILNVTISGSKEVFEVTGAAFETSEQYHDIYEPELFGGKEEGGGWVGNYSFYPGDWDQGVNSYVSEFVGSGNLPAYRGVCHIVFEDNYMGETPQLRKMEFELSCYHSNLGRQNFGRLNLVSFDACLMEMAYLILTDVWKGLGIPAEKVNLASFAAAADTLEAEGNGGSMLVTSSKSGKDVLTEILRQADAILRQNADGEIEIFLIRDDYVEGDLDVYDENDIIAIRSYSRTAWEDVVSEVRVSFSTRDTDSQRVAIAHNMAVANMIGRRRSIDLNFPLCYEPDLALDIAARELARLSLPLFKMQVEMNRNGFQLVPGDVIKISWSEYGFEEVIMRVQKIDTGKLFDNRVVVDLVQDVFAAAETTMAAPEDSQWVTPDTEPVEIVTFDTIEVPHWLFWRMTYPPQPYDPFSGLVYWPGTRSFDSLIVMPVEPAVKSSGYDVVRGLYSGFEDYFDPEAAEYPWSGLITENFSYLEGWDTGKATTGFTFNTLVGGDDENDYPPSYEVSEIRSGEAGYIFMNGEWMAYESVTDNLDGTYTFNNLYRGLFHTRPVSHTAGDRFFIIEQQHLGQGFLNSTEATDTIYFKMLDNFAGKTFERADATSESHVLTKTQGKPNRVRYIQLDSSRTPNPIIVNTDVTNISWRDHDEQNSQIAFENDAATVANGDGVSNDYFYGEERQVYIDIYIDGVLHDQVTINHTPVSAWEWVDNYDYTWSGIPSDAESGEIRVRTRAPSTPSVAAEDSFTYAMFPVIFETDLILLSGDATDGDDKLLLSGDAQSGTDKLKVS